MIFENILASRSIIVMGACGKLGRHLTKGIIEAGGSVIALDHDLEMLIKLRKLCGNTIKIVAVDMADLASLNSIRAKTGSNFDGAINAAYPRNQNYGRPLLEVEYDDFCDNVSQHLGGYFQFMQACIRYSVETKREFSLVNISSIYGSLTPRFEIYNGTEMTMPVEYAAIKAGLEHITRYVNSYMKSQLKTSFRANCLSPGGISDGQPQLFTDSYRKMCLQKGLLNSEDIVGAAVFLLSEHSRFVAGQNLVVDDGFSI